MNEYKIIILRERPELAPIAAEWFHCKWGVPTEAYLLAALYNAPLTISNYYQAMYNNDHANGLV